MTALVNLHHVALACTVVSEEIVLKIRATRLLLSLAPSFSLCRVRVTIAHKLPQSLGSTFKGEFFPLLINYRYQSSLHVANILNCANSFHQILKVTQFLH